MADLAWPCDGEANPELDVSELRIERQRHRRLSEVFDRGRRSRYAPVKETSCAGKNTFR